MKVENVIMYHISPKLHWNVGDVIVAGEVNNPFWEICKNYSLMVRVDGQEMSIIDITKNAPNFSVSQQNIDFLYSNLKTITKEFSFFCKRNGI